MAPFIPFDGQVVWDVSPALEATRGFSFVFGSNAPYEAYLFVLNFRQLGAQNLLSPGQMSLATVSDE